MGQQQARTRPPPAKSLLDTFAAVSQQTLDPNKMANSAMTQVSALEALPLDTLFMTPFQAAIDAQKIMSQATAFFVQEMGVDQYGEMYTFTSSAYYDIPAANVKDASGNQAYYLYQLGTDADTPCLDPSGVGLNAKGAKKFTGKEGTYDVSGTSVAVDHSGRIIGSQGQRSITLPFLSILNVPALTMTDVTVDLKMEIKTNYSATVDNSSNTTQATNAGNWNNDAGAGGSNGGYAWTGTNTTASVSNQNTATDTSSSKSVYEVHMGAKYKVPVGMKMMLDFMTNNISDSSPKQVISDDGYSTVQDPATNIFVAMGKV